MACYTKATLSPGEAQRGRVAQVGLWSGASSVWPLQLIRLYICSGYFSCVQGTGRGIGVALAAHPPEYSHHARSVN